MRILLHSLLCVAYLSSNLALDLPSKPVDLQCIALQNGKKVSSKLTCQWDLEEKAPKSLTSYTLYAQYREEPLSVVSDEALASKLTIDLNSFPHYMKIKVWVEAKNELGSVNSTPLVTDAESFVKTNPPNVTLKADFPTTLNVTWAPPINEPFFLLMYNIRYCQAGSSVWTEVLQNITSVKSYRLQVLQPYTDYVVQMRCINHRNIGYWSDWSPNATACTPEARPESKPDLWRVYEESDNTVKLIWKDPVKPNGKILAYNITVEENGVNPVSFTVHSREHQLHLNGGTTWIRMTASNSAGISPMATLKIPQRGQDLRAGAEQMRWSVRDGKLWVDWLPPSGSRVSEYVLEWVSILYGQRDWQRVPAQRNATSYSVPLKGHFKPFIRYNISVCPIYRELHEKKSFYNLPGKKVTVGAYLKQGPPLEGPSVEVTPAQKNSVHLKWKEIPVAKQQGFLTNYTIFYKTGDREQFVIVGPDVHSYKLTGLASASQYVVHVMASNVEGSVNGSNSSLYTKYDDSKIKVIVVLFCLGFLFIFFIMILSVKKREVIKKHLWPQVSSPYLSSVANWSPDSFTRMDTKKVALPEVSVAEVGMFNGKKGTRHCEEDKTVLPLKKDKYFSEEHSSGIGGSSCMSSQRQSVSDSDEGDSCQTTASTVQYSSVVASGYKGQTPSLQTPVFARSESTQPLLDSEEHPEHLLEGSCHQRSTSFRRGRGLEQLQEGGSSYISLNFCPMAEKNDTPNHIENLLTQLSGYRPQ